MKIGSLLERMRKGKEEGQVREGGVGTARC